MKFDDCFDSLRKAYAEWGDYFVNKRFCASDGTISWFNNSISRHSSVLGSEEFARIVELQQYSFQLIEDGSVFRIYYKFDSRGRSLVEMTLSFLSAPRGDVYCEPSIGGLAVEGTSHWIRIDYSASEASHKVPNHNACHLHLSSLPNARLALSRVPSPRQFVSWVMSMHYPDEHDKLLSELGASGYFLNSPSFPLNWESELKHWVHLLVPPFGR